MPTTAAVTQKQFSQRVTGALVERGQWGVAITAKDMEGLTKVGGAIDLVTAKAS